MGVLNGKVAVVTGASRGLGEAMAVGFATAGASVALAARTETDLQRVAERCRAVAAGTARMLVVPTDVAEPDAASALVDAVEAQLGSLDVFVANAGVAVPSLTSDRPKTLDAYDYDLAAELLRINTLGTWLSMKTALPAMRDGASFIAIGSELGRLAMAGSGVYAVSKASVDVLVRIAAAENADRGVRVNELSPGGMVDTHLFGPHKMPEGMKAHLAWSEPEVIVPAALWLASDDSTGVNGRHLVAKEFNARPVAETLALLMT